MTATVEQPAARPPTTGRLPRRPVVGWAIFGGACTLINWLRPSVFYIAELVNLGSWSERVPFWIGRNARFHIEPPLMIGAVYLWLGLAFAVIASSAMRRAKRRWPHLSTLRLAGIAWLSVFSLEFFLDPSASGPASACSRWSASSTPRR